MFEVCKNAKKVSIDGFDNLDFFLNKNKLGLWAVHDSLTGCRLTKLHKDLKSCLNEIKKICNRSSEQKIILKIILSLKKRKLSPRYRYIVNPSKIR